jgi:hypothetical protein
VLPGFKGAPPSRYYAIPGGVVATVIRSGPTPLLLTELRGDQTWLSKKLVGQDTKIEPARVDVYDGLFLSGGRHVLLYEVANGTEVRQLATRFAGNVLLWSDGTRTYRLEGRVSRDDAIRLANLISG